MPIPEIVLGCFIAFAVVIIVIAITKSAKDKSDAERVRKAQEEARESFLKKPLYERGKAGFILKAEPHTLTVCRYANILPESELLDFGPVVFHDSEALANLIIEESAIHRVRWLFPDGTFSVVKVRPGGALVHGEDFVRERMAEAFAKDKLKTAAVMAEEYPITEKGRADDTAGIVNKH